MDQRRYWKEKDDDPEVDVQRMKVVREALGFCGEEPSLLYVQIPRASKARGKGKLVRSPFTLHVVATTLMIGASPGVRDQAIGPYGAVWTISLPHLLDWHSRDHDLGNVVLPNDSRHVRRGRCPQRSAWAPINSTFVFAVVITPDQI